MNVKIAYLCLDVTREGQASYAHVTEIIAGLRNHGVEVTLFQPYYVKNKKSPRGLLRFWGMFLCQLRLWLQRSVDCIYIRSHFAAFPTALWAKICRIRVVQEVNGPYADLFMAWPWTLRLKPLFVGLMKTQFLWADVLISVTSELKSWLITEGVRAPIFVIPSGVNTNLFKLDVTTSFSLPKPYVIFFGSLAPWQGIRALLTAVECEVWPQEVYLVIAGDGKERPLIEATAKRIKRVVYLGSVPYSQVPGLVTESLCGVSPQNSEYGRSNTGLNPLKVFETLACGIPVIVTDFPGQADLVKEYQCGLVVPPDDPIALAEAVKRFYLNEKMRREMGHRGHICVKAFHSWERRAEETYRVLRNLCEAP